VSDRPSEGQPFSYGGQAVLEGVMMRGRDNWAVAVRRPQGEIYVEQRGLRPLAARFPLFRLPFLRGIGVLADSLGIGMRALSISGNQALGEEEQLSDRQMGWSLAIGAVFFSLLFILIPATGTNWLSRHLPSNLAFNLVEGLVRLGFFLAYIALISQLKDIRRVFEYHGAEHKAIHCHEAKLPLTPENVDRFPTLHVRCGTNFLLILFVVTLVLFTVGFSLLGRPPLLVRVPLQLVATVVADADHQAAQPRPDRGGHPRAGARAARDRTEPDRPAPFGAGARLAAASSGWPAGGPAWRWLAPAAEPARAANATPR
jgi:uncharacterized protein YqhQ